MEPAAKRVKTSHKSSSYNDNDDRAAAAAAAVVVKVKMLHNPARSGQVKASILDATNKQNMKQIGTIDARLVPRSKSFHGKCDEISSHLQAIGCAMFDSDGAPRCVEIFGAPAGRKKPFLYISEFQLEDDLNVTSSDVGAEALKQFLDFVDGKWSVAAYIADNTNGMTKAEREELRRLEDRRESRGEGNRQSLEEMKLTRKSVSLDVRKFVRNGFKELSEETASDPGWVYATPEMWTSWNQDHSSKKMTHDEAMEVKLRCDEALDPQKYNNDEKDVKLVKLLVTKGQDLYSEYEGGGDPFSSMMMGVRGFSSSHNQPTVASIMEEADELVADGADYNRSNALHACAANGITQLLDPLVSRGALVNAKDRNKATPLICAAAIAPGRVTKYKPTPPANDIRALLALGADKNIQDGSGKTALGHFYASTRNNNDFCKCFGVKIGNSGIDPTIERLLMPTGGATAADRRCK